MTDIIWKYIINSLYNYIHYITTYIAASFSPSVFLDKHFGVMMAASKNCEDIGDGINKTEGVDSGGASYGCFNNGEHSSTVLRICTLN